MYKDLIFHVNWILSLYSAFGRGVSTYVAGVLYLHIYSGATRVVSIAKSNPR